MRYPNVMLSVLVVALALASAPAAAERVNVRLSGLEEVPANMTTASGSLRLFINDREGTIDYELTYDGLEGNITQAHIHVGQAGVNGGISVWLCQTAGTPAPPAVAADTPFCPQAGTVTGQLTAASVIGPTAQRVDVGNLGELIDAIRSGVAYGNVHSSVLGGGEIRGQLH